MQLTEEVWRPVVGNDSYDVSNLGRIRSWRNPGKKPGRATEPHFLKPCAGGEQRKYLMVTLSGDPVKRYMHDLVADAFLGPRPERLYVAHWDGDGHNNIVTNLRYATNAQNMADKIRHGRTNRGERCGSRKLSWVEVQQIRDLYGPYRRYRRGIITQRDLARMFGISQQQVNRIVSQNHWDEEWRESAA